MSEQDSSSSLEGINNLNQIHSLVRFEDSDEITDFDSDIFETELDSGLERELSEPEALAYPNFGDNVNLQDYEETSDSEDSLDDDQGNNNGATSTSSSSDSESDGTQIWVPSVNQKTPTSTLKNSPHSISAVQSPVSPGSVSQTVFLPPVPPQPSRHSIISHNSTTGRYETVIVEDEMDLVPNGDSGISNNESPDNISALEQPVIQFPPPPPQVNGGHRVQHHTDPHTQREQFSSSLYNILSGLYAVFIIIIGVVLPIGEIFAERITANYFEGFYIYLYGLSIIFLSYVYIYLLQNNTWKRGRKKSHCDSLLGKPKWKKVEIDEVSKNTGSFYLRLGAVVFGIASMIHDGLWFGQFFEHGFHSECNELILGIRPILHLVFTFIQLYFIFLNSKMCIHRYKHLARFGLMHMIATNICVWLRNVIRETVRDVQIYQRSNIAAVAMTINQTEASTVTFENITESHQHTECDHHDIFGDVVDKSSAYLYPCTIVYSIICAGILYVIWLNIGKTIATSRGVQSEQIERKLVLHVDCNASHRGLFCGIFILLATVITIITFLIFINKAEYINTAVLMVHIIEIVIYMLTSIAVFAACSAMRHLYYDYYRYITLDEILLLVSQTGVFLAAIFSLLAAIYSYDTIGGVLILATSCLVLIQSAAQTVLVLSGLRRFTGISDTTQRPGRQFVTFLLVANVALCGLCMMETVRSSVNPVQQEFYGYLVWSIILHVSIPLQIFYRFHSAVCLANIWKNAYKPKQL
ncbi:unnamed protein product [Owenia fusiformis]|uniref:Uncharacterized protein n=1 Tax=Owenia fusiformis TaxID=6347 RepID=A0A8J1XLH9_OWEFU|nr:unnamed protein product [Owenia fusiformis]